MGVRSRHQGERNEASNTESTLSPYWRRHGKSIEGLLWPWHWPCWERDRDEIKKAGLRLRKGTFARIIIVRLQNNLWINTRVTESYDVIKMCWDLIIPNCSAFCRSCFHSFASFDLNPVNFNLTEVFMLVKCQCVWWYIGHLALKGKHNPFVLKGKDYPSLWKGRIIRVAISTHRLRVTMESSRWSIRQCPHIYLEGIPISRKRFRKRLKMQHICKIKNGESTVK